MVDQAGQPTAPQHQTTAKANPAPTRTSSQYGVLQGVAWSWRYGVRGVDCVADTQRVHPDVWSKQQRDGWQRAQTAASLELSTGKSVIAIGGFSGTDDAPTLEQFKEWVAEGKIAYYISGGQGGGGGLSSAASEIQ